MKEKGVSMSDYSGASGAVSTDDISLDNFIREAKEEAVLSIIDIPSTPEFDDPEASERMLAREDEARIQVVRDGAVVGRSTSGDLAQAIYSRQYNGDER